MEANSRHLTDELRQNSPALFVLCVPSGVSNVASWISQLTIELMGFIGVDGLWLTYVDIYTRVQVHWLGYGLWCTIKTYIL